MGRPRRSGRTRSGCSPRLGIYADLAGPVGRRRPASRAAVSLVGLARLLRAARPVLARRRPAPGPPSRRASARVGSVRRGLSARCWPGRRAAPPAAATAAGSRSPSAELRAAGGVRRCSRRPSRCGRCSATGGAALGASLRRRWSARCILTRTAFARRGRQDRGRRSGRCTAGSEVAQLAGPTWIATSGVSDDATPRGRRTRRRSGLYDQDAGRCRSRGAPATRAVARKRDVRVPNEPQPRASSSRSTSGPRRPKRRVEAAAASSCSSAARRAGGRPRAGRGGRAAASSRRSPPTASRPASSA